MDDTNETLPEAPEDTAPNATGQGKEALSEEAGTPSAEGEQPPLLMMEDPAVGPQAVVAIGASAGGLDALERLFSGLPSDTGAAYVVIQHLSPDHKSIMASLLARHTKMPVVTVEDEMALAPNSVFLIPPATIMTLEGRHLRLAPKDRRVLSLPIDAFFTSMAAGYGDRAVAVVLSGTGSDGTRGVSAVHAAGGVAIAQDPRDARFDGMPRSAIATGFIDSSMNIDRIGPWIADYLVRRPALAAAAAADAADGPKTGADSKSALPRQFEGLEPQEALGRIVEILSLSGEVNFTDYKAGTVQRRIERRMGVRQITELSSYLELLTQDRAELATLRREMLIPVTSFFRDPESFAELSERVIEPLVAEAAVGSTLRVWSAGCATGEEAYTIAMLFFDAFERAGRWPTLKIFATDVEPVNIEQAATGFYPETIAADLPSTFLERFFTPRGGQFVVRPELRQSIVFARHNLLSDPPFTRMDLVSCRNTLIYLRPEAQERALKRMHYALRPGGYLFLGGSEALVQVQDDFTVLSARHRIWQAQRSGSAPLTDRKTGLYVNPRPPRSRSENAPQTAMERGFAALQKAYAPPPSLLINARHEILHSYGDISGFMKLREGVATLEIGRMLIEPLLPVASALLFKAARLGEEAMSDPLHLAEGVAGPEPFWVRLKVMPVAAQQEAVADDVKLYLLSFETVPSDEDDVPAIDIDREVGARIEMLEAELAMTRESLQAMIEELETSNEELQATNEEMMASNEELQSANEELQSVNEELNSVNAEYQEKIDLLNRSNADLDSLTRIMAMGAIFVDADLRVTRFSPDAVDLFRIRDVDIGRPLGDITHRLDYAALLDDLRRTIKGQTRTEREVTGLNGRHYLVRMLPYKVPSSAAQGVVLTFVDITQTRNLQLLQAVIDGLAEHVAVLDHKGDIMLVNAAWTRFAAENGDPGSEHTGVGVNYVGHCDLGDTAIDSGYATRAVDGIRAVLQGRLSRFSLEYPCDAPDCPRWFVMHVRPLDDPIQGAVVSHIEITRWRENSSEEPAVT
ncbi:two-component system CheB/CheR fusion protein [Rhodobacter aestuarii]|uniref:Two-component system, chemotaxis family, CheB/CheR fusion protein n=1 Tax=Rhodobacter aestuarii TaxID=453582 RepID=A0A1N7KYH5_9RHOB|nr:CheR family methyltransferase [Rhodobacter aestuarii]PTV95501.1 two-component system CheB/CheR fusion protein [Rhodobacter aestuarii]SIS66597.1 two-component system, chemotaxis family, CheB/CheR fusion protein [Rhodobacter aestuarii]